MTSARTVDELVGKARTATILAGGTDLLPQREQGLASSAALVSISEVVELRRHWVDGDGGLVLGAGLTLAELVRATGISPVVAETAATIATPQVRELATVAGNLLQAKRCWFYRNGFDCYKRVGWTAPCYAVTGDHRFHHAAIDGHRCQAVTPSDLAGTFLSLDGEVCYEDARGRSSIGIDRLYRGPGESRLRPEAVVLSVRIPPAARRRVGVFEKLALWEGDFAVTSVAITVVADAATVRQPRVVLGAVAPVPLRLTGVERALDGCPWDEAGERAEAAVICELHRRGHPLPGNAWKLFATEGMLRKAVDRLRAYG